MDKTAMFNLTYGLYVLTCKAQDSLKDNGCILDAVMQLTDDPLRIAAGVNRGHLSNEIIQQTGEFNLSVLTKDVPQELIANFGFQSGRQADKFLGDLELETERGTNGIYFLTSYTNAYLECKVIDACEYGTHTLFVADVTKLGITGKQQSITYTEYRQRSQK